jgi:hypothetical protein
MGLTVPIGLKYCSSIHYHPDETDKLFRKFPLGTQADSHKKMLFVFRQSVKPEAKGIPLRLILVDDSLLFAAQSPYFIYVYTNPRSYSLIFKQISPPRTYFPRMYVNNAKFVNENFKHLPSL